MSKPSSARSRTTNWSSYNASLRERGALLIWVDKDMTWLAPHEGRRGRPAVFSDAAIQFCLSIKILFKLPLRQTAGMVASLLKLAGLDWPAPDFSTLCRRQKNLAVQVPYRRADGPLNLLVDSTGIKFLGDGEWQARKHGNSGATPVAQATSGHGPGHIGHPRRGVHVKPRRRQPRAARPAKPDPGERTDRHSDRGRRLRYAPLPQSHHRARRGSDHPDPQERAAVEG